MARLPKGSPTLRDVLREQRRQLRAQGTSSPFTNSGLAVTAPGVVDASKATMLFAPSSIGNDALASPYGDADKAAVAQASTDAAGAQTAAGEAKATAASKTVTIVSDTQPPTTGRTVGDEWLDSAHDNARYVWDGSAWTPRLAGSAAIANELVGKTLTGSLVRTATGGSRVEIDDMGGLVAYASDGVTKNVAIFNKGEVNNPTGTLSGIWLGKNVGLRLQGTTTKDAVISKTSSVPDGTAGDSLRLRAAEDTLSGAGANFYENVNTSGTDGDGDDYNGSTRFYNGALQTLKLLKNRTAVFGGGIRALAMRTLTASGGTSTTRAATTWGLIDSGPNLIFTAPPSGIVRVVVNISIGTPSATVAAMADVQIREGDVLNAGTFVLQDPPGILTTTSASMRAEASRLVAGLTPGMPYHTRAVIKASGTGVTITGGFTYLTVIPSM